MNDYYEVRYQIEPCTEDTTDLLAALLGDIGYESFVPDALGLTAYIKCADYDEAAADEVAATFPMPCRITRTTTFVEGRDWNKEWEQYYFKPIVVGGECVIHSSFHTDVPRARYDIVIDPKMAFGTGHHATTSLMLEQILQLPLDGASVCDMGTGTGILALLCAMRGATEVYAVEIDEFACENTRENLALNGHPEITLYCSDASALKDIPAVDVFLANINRNIITADLPAYAAALRPGGVMLLSGFYEHDIPVVMQAAAPLGLEETGHTVKGDGWACLKLHKPLP